MSSAALHAIPPITQPYHVAALQATPNASPVSSRKGKARSLSASAPQTQSPTTTSQHHQQLSQQPQHRSSQQPQHQTSQQTQHQTSPSYHGQRSSAQNSSSAMTRPMEDPSTSHYTSTYHDPQIEGSSSSAHRATSTPQQPALHDISAYDSLSERESYKGSPVQRRAAYPAAAGQGAQQSTVNESLPRENSNIINRVVVADPQEDIERAQARMVDPPADVQRIAAQNTDDNSRSAPRSRQEHLRTGPPRKETKFGEYFLGQTLGEGEFGKVKMGWKKDGGVQVAIKLIRKETLGDRRYKINREIGILGQLKHPNIVRLHEMVETERHIGIILEYASGGELFDYILRKRHLNDREARKLFAQLVSGVGYLHKKGIVHRDLKLENLLLDRNKNIIITDFGFANAFNPADELGEDVERGLADKDFVRSNGLDQVSRDGLRRGDLMQTSCGSPCYAAPELVISDTLYTGRKTDVWSLGVILYAMLAGYLPFDDDPTNPDGDNIQRLYAYITTTPLTFPEQITPHARDLLRRVLVPDPRKRADLFEVARHSWLAEYAHVVEQVTSSATPVEDIIDSTVPSDDPFAASQLGRSHSVREPTRTTQPMGPDSLISKHTTRIDATDRPVQHRDDRHKRATLQIEYVPPNSSTTRGEPITALPPLQAMAPPGSGSSRSRARADVAQGAVEIGPYPHQSPVSTRQQRPVTQSNMAPPARPGREPPRAVSDSTALNMNPPPSSRDGRPGTSGTMDRVGGSRLPSRGNSYGQAIAPTVAATNAEGRFSQPKNSGYYMSGSMPDGSNKRSSYAGRPNSQHFFAPDLQRHDSESKMSRGHKRSSTVESITSKIFGRTPSRRQSSGREDAVRSERPSRAYPPVSMRNSMLNDPDRPRTSVDPGRPSFGAESRKNSEPYQQSQQQNRQSRRFSSFLPQSFSRMSFSSTPKSDAHEGGDSKRESMGPHPPSSRHSGRVFQGLDRSSSQNTAGSNIPVLYDNVDQRGQGQRRMPQNQAVRGATAPDLMKFGQESGQPRQGGQQGYESAAPLSQSETRESQRVRTAGGAGRGFSESEQTGSPRAHQRQPSVLQKPRKLGEAHESNGASSNSSGGARRVMDWFRKRGKERSG